MHSPDSPPVIEVAGLVKHYGKVVAVDGIDFSVPAGATVALLGGNGAGKTTTLSMLLGLLLPTAGGSGCWARTCCATATGCWPA